MTNEFTGIVEQDGEWFIAYSPEIPGANGQDRTKDEALQSLTEAIALILEDRRPRFHAYYGEHDVAIAVQDGALLSGSLPRRAMTHVQEWRQAHVAELEADWQRARARQPLEPIEPLE